LQPFFAFRIFSAAFFFNTDIATAKKKSGDSSEETREEQQEKVREWLRWYHHSAEVTQYGIQALCALCSNDRQLKEVKYEQKYFCLAVACH
jgi:hypothetical protein